MINRALVRFLIRCESSKKRSNTTKTSSLGHENRFVSERNVSLKLLNEETKVVTAKVGRVRVRVREVTTLPRAKVSNTTLVASWSDLSLN